MKWKKQQQTITCQWNSCYPNSWLSCTIRHNRATCAPELCTTALTTPWIFCQARDSVEANMTSRTFSLLCWKKRHVPHRKMHARKAWKCEALKNICVNPVTPSFPGSAAGAAALKCYLFYSFIYLFHLFMYLCIYAIIYLFMCLFMYLCI